jgi:hypothetical protein
LRICFYFLFFCRVGKIKRIARDRKERLDVLKVLVKNPENTIGEFERLR